MSAGLGLRAFRGGAVAVAVSVEKGEPRILLSTILATSTDDDRLSREPYHVAVEMARGPDGKASAEAAAAVTEGRRCQDALATQSLQDIVRQLKEMGHEPALAALIVNRAGWVTNLLDYSLAWPDHAPVAEGLAVRDALRAALSASGIETIEYDEKILHDLAPHTLNMWPAEIDAHLKAMGTTAGKPWRKEQKLACLAAWMAMGALR